MACEVIEGLFDDKWLTVDQDKAQVHYKNMLQHTVHERHGARPDYVLVGATGPEHNKVFEIEVRVRGQAFGHGTGSTKKEAEMNAAKAALEVMKSEGTAPDETEAGNSQLEIGH